MTFDSRCARCSRVLHGDPDRVCASCAKDALLATGNLSTASLGENLLAIFVGGIFAGLAAIVPAKLAEGTAVAEAVRLVREGFTQEAAARATGLAPQNVFAALRVREHRLTTSVCLSISDWVTQSTTKEPPPCQTPPRRRRRRSRNVSLPLKN